MAITRCATAQADATEPQTDSALNLDHVLVQPFQIGLHHDLAADGKTPPPGRNDDCEKVA
jgi:hypothetical protein